MMMRFRGGGIGHKATRHLDELLLQDGLGIHEVPNAADEGDGLNDQEMESEEDEPESEDEDENDADANEDEDDADRKSVV